MRLAAYVLYSLYAVACVQAVARRTYTPDELRPGDVVYIIPEFGRAAVVECRVRDAEPGIRPSGPRRDVVLSFMAWDGPSWYSVPAAGLYRTRAAASSELAAQLRRQADRLRRQADLLDGGEFWP